MPILEPAIQPGTTVPFFKPSITDLEIDEVVACLRSGWLTTGPRTKQFEADFAASVGASHAVGLNSCTAALHLAVEAIGLKAGEGVLVPTMTFAATAEVVRYQGAVPILVDCDSKTLNMDLEDAALKVDQFQSAGTGTGGKVAGMIPVHVGGAMMDMDAVNSFAERHRLWVIEDAAHALPAAFRTSSRHAWRRCGEDTAAVTCFSFYANKTITTGEGGMAVTNDSKLAGRMRQMALHGLSHDAWKRYSGGSSWDYRITAPGYKYNLTDIAASIGSHQLARAEELRGKRESLARRYCQGMRAIEELELPDDPCDRVHSWHLFPIRLRLDCLTIDRNGFMELLGEYGIGCSVHWRPLHLHPYYEETFDWKAADCPVATREWQRLISLPLFPEMSEEEQDYVVRVVRELCAAHSTRLRPTRGRRRPKPR